MDDDRHAAGTPSGQADEDQTAVEPAVRSPGGVEGPEHDRAAPGDPIALGESSDGAGAMQAREPAPTGDGDQHASDAHIPLSPPATDEHPEAAQPEDGALEAAAGTQGDAGVAEEEMATTLTTTCPVCGRTTPANHFCGYCGAPLTETRPRAADRDPMLRLAGRVHDALFPSTQPIDMFWHRLVVPVAILIALIALLANDIGIALIVTAAIAPTLLILTLRQLDVFERESPLLSAAAAVAGLIGGLVIGGVMSWATHQWWFSTGGFNHGAAGYGAEFAKRAGAAPFLLLLVNGIVLPAVGVAAMLLGPIALRRFNQFRNEAMDGLVLGALGGAGYVLGTVIIFVLPVIGDPGPRLSVRHWTLLVLGLAFFRPLIVTIGAAIFGAGLWRYLMTERAGTLIVPAAAGVGGIVLLFLGTMILEPRSLALEVGWNLLLQVVMLGVLSLVLRQSIAYDRRVIGADNTRVTCPSCGQVTPRGAFCAHCGHALPAMETA